MTRQKKRRSPFSMFGAACLMFLLGLACQLSGTGSALYAQTKTAKQHYQNGVAQLEAKKYDDAIAAFNAALKLQPKHEPAYQKRAEAYQKKIAFLNGAGQYEEALHTVQTALENSIRLAREVVDVNANILPAVWESAVVTSIKKIAVELPATFELQQNYPNPFNPATTIKFSLPRAGHVTLKVFDLVGREIATLVDKELTAGQYDAHWDATSVESGVYFYQLRAGDFVETKRLVLLK